MADEELEEKKAGTDKKAEKEAKKAAKKAEKEAKKAAKKADKENKSESDDEESGGGKISTILLKCKKQKLSILYIILPLLLKEHIQLLLNNN